MANAELHFTQGATSPGPGFAMIGTVGTSVTVSNGDDSNVGNWEFTVLDTGTGSEVPQGIVQNGTTPTWAFTPDVSGTYVVQLVTTDKQGNLYEDVRCFSVLETNGGLIPSFLAGASSMNYVISSVVNQKGWSPFLNAWLKLVLEGGGGGGGGNTSYDQNCTGGGTIAYSGPAQVPALVNLTGTPAGEFVFVPPSTKWAATIQNLSGRAAAIGTSGFTLYSGDTVLFANDGGGDDALPLIGGNVTGPGAGDLYLFNSGNGPVWTALALAGANSTFSGQIQDVPIYGATLQHLDADTWGVTSPIGASGPTGTPAGQFWYASSDGSNTPSLGNGEFCISETGAAECLAPQAYYPGASWSTQGQAGLVACSGDTITGPSTQVVHYFQLLNGFATKFTVELIAKAVVVGSGTMVAGDFATAETSISASGLDGAAHGCVAPTPIVLPANGSSANLVDVELSVSFVGDDLAVGVTSSATAGETDTTDFQLRITARVC